MRLRFACYDTSSNCVAVLKFNPISALLLSTAALRKLLHPSAMVRAAFSVALWPTRVKVVQGSLLHQNNLLLNSTLYNLLRPLDNLKALHSRLVPFPATSRVPP
jgi:hypothetical protein